MNATTRLLIAASVVVALGACAKKTKPVEETAAPQAPAATAPASDGRYTPGDLDTDSCLRQRSVYFDFDMDLVKPEFQAIMACHAKYLRDRPEARITLEGNADERGSREYNVALGERRGNAVNAALQSSSGQLTVVSYGEERPTCTESSEGCWQKNRRVDIVYTAK